MVCKKSMNQILGYQSNPIDLGVIVDYKNFGEEIRNLLYLSKSNLLNVWLGN